MPRALILIVEDDADIREAASELLRDAGYLVGRAPDGRHALNFLSQVRPDVIVLDLMMPVMSRFEFARRSSRMSDWRTS